MRNELIKVDRSAKKFIAIWNAGWGQAAEVIEVEDEEKALKKAYEFCKNDAEKNWHYEAIPWTEEDEEYYCE